MKIGTQTTNQQKKTLVTKQNYYRNYAFNRSTQFQKVTDSLNIFRLHLHIVQVLLFSAAKIQ